MALVKQKPKKFSSILARMTRDQIIKAARLSAACLDREEIIKIYREVLDGTR